MDSNGDSMILEKLYALSSNGKIKTWEIEADGDTMIIRSGYIDGRLVEQTKIIDGKNIGRSNETTPEQQCELECQSKWQKKIDQQYTTSLEDVKSYKDQEILLPMLAHRFDKRKKDITYPCYVQPKLNGVRCVYQGGKFMSRTGKEYTTLAHLVPELEQLGIDIPDGEIYVHGMSFQDIIRRVKKDRGTKTQELEYWVYDQILDTGFKIRNLDLNTCFSTHTGIKVKPVMTIVVNSEKEIKEWHNKWVAEGYEGIIIRNAEGPYKVKHRSKDLQKYKEFIDDEFEIIGFHEGTGNDQGTVVFELQTKGGKQFSVRPRGTHEMRSHWLEDIDNIIGKELTVRYQELSEDGVPIFPVGIEIRDYE